jgi:hypothetical protein
MIPNLKDEVKDNKKVKFEFYRGRELWYKTESGFVFPVPIEDVGDATFLPEDKAILYMRYIRKHIEELKKEEIEKCTCNETCETPCKGTCGCEICHKSYADFLSGD